MFTFKIDGVNMPIPAPGGFNLGFADLDSAKSGRNAKGYMRRERKRTKMRQIDIKYNAMTSNQFVVLYNAILPEMINVTYYDPAFGILTKTMYASDISLPIYAEIGGNIIWESMSFVLTEE